MGDKIIRYQFERQCNCMCDVIADKEGEFVGYDDYESLQADVERYREALESIVGQTDDQMLDGVWREVNTTAQTALKPTEKSDEA